MNMPRCVLLMGLTVACGGSFLLEQPGSSVMADYFRMAWFCRQIRVAWLIYAITITPWTLMYLNFYLSWSLYRVPHELFDPSPFPNSWYLIQAPIRFPVLVASDQVYTFTWKMGSFEGATSEKPERGWTNNKQFARISLPYKRDPSSKKSGKPTVIKTISKSGKRSYSGTKELKNTQYRP